MVHHFKGSLWLWFWRFVLHYGVRSFSPWLVVLIGLKLAHGRQNILCHGWKAKRKRMVTHHMILGDALNYLKSIYQSPCLKGSTTPNNTMLEPCPNHRFFWKTIWTQSTGSTLWCSCHILQVSSWSKTGWHAMPGILALHKWTNWWSML